MEFHLAARPRVSLACLNPEQSSWGLAGRAGSEGLSVNRAVEQQGEHTAGSAAAPSERALRRSLCSERGQERC